MIVLQCNVCDSGHPSLKEEGGEMMEFIFYFEFQNIYKLKFLILKGACPNALFRRA